MRCGLGYYVFLSSTRFRSCRRHLFVDITSGHWVPWVFPSGLCSWCDAVSVWGNESPCYFLIFELACGRGNSANSEWSLSQTRSQRSTSGRIPHYFRLTLFFRFIFATTRSLVFSCSIHFTLGSYECMSSFSPISESRKTPSQLLFNIFVVVSQLAENSLVNLLRKYYRIALFFFVFSSNKIFE